MTLNRREARHEYTRGAEVMRHEFSMYFSALFFSFMIALIAGMGTSVFVFNALLERNEGQIILKRIAAKYHVATNKPDAPVLVELKVGSGTKNYELPSQVFLDKTAVEWASISTKFWWTILISVICAIALFLITNRAWRGFGKQVGIDEVVRGTVFADPAVIKRELAQAGRASDIAFAGVPLEKGKEVLNTMISGAIGTGKSVAIAEALFAIRAVRSRAIIYDPTGEYIERFYRSGRDIILNPFDVRSPAWKPWNEVRKPYDYANMAQSLIPVMNTKEPFWEEGAQAVLEDVMSRLAKANEPTNRRLIEVVNILSLSEIRELVEKLPGAVYMDPEAGKTALGIRMSVVRAARALRFMGDGDPENQFSIRDWVHGPDQDSWLFLSAREDMLATVRPLITAWFDTALRAIMTLPPDRNRLMWNVIDELASLNKINTMKEATTRARKYGLASILGYQNIAQMREIYGANDAQTIVSMCQNTLTLRVPDFQTAEYIAKNLGSQEIFERDENISFGSDPQRDGVTISTKCADRDLVKPSEIQGLPDLTGYMRLAGRNDVMKVAFAYRQYPHIAKAFEEKQVTSYDLDE
ncbi:type IV secretion system DNA-binding domain-containing protein [Rhodoferax sp.]|uniref:type IV secretion system DNA-binding domain-containing protein n=1 Tax=Rhodoferax sp. TaxID=50421 RepID=UPI002777E21D|nr:type IV secretion system DNA-binding domain-containing protein [Rhodoferax sp.]